MNPVTACIGCEQEDDHPKHVIGLPDGSDVRWHMDCHATATKCESCTWQREGAGKKTGEAFREHIQKIHK